MAAHLFYFVGLWIFLLNLILTTNIIKFLKIQEWVVKFNKISGRFPVKMDFKENDFEYFLFTNSVVLLTFFWLFCGLISNSWPISLFLILFNVLLASLSKLTGFNILSLIINTIKNVVSTSLIGFLVFNHYHLHLDIIKLLFG